MKRMNKIELEQKAEKIVFRWVCMLGVKNADNLSKIIRRKFIKLSKGETKCN